MATGGFYVFMCVHDIMRVCFGDPPPILATQNKSQGRIDTPAHLPPDLGGPASAARNLCLLLTPKTADPLPLQQRVDQQRSRSYFLSTSSNPRPTPMPSPQQIII